MTYYVYYDRNGKGECYYYMARFEEDPTEYIATYNKEVQNDKGIYEKTDKNHYQIKSANRTPA